MPYRPSIVLLLFLATTVLLATPVLLATAVHAGEAAKPAAPPRAAHVGRGLIASDPDVRARAIATLQEDIAAGRTTPAYLDALADAAATWADDSARLADVWIERAVEGDARERRVAVRLLHALGPDAVERLALELRHQRHRPGTKARTQPESVAEVAPQPPQELPAIEVLAVKDTRIAKIYLVRGLQRGGMNRLQVRSFLEKHANASNVKGYGDRYTVLADKEGHQKLAKALAEHDLAQQGAALADPAPAGATHADGLGARRDAAPTLVAPTPSSAVKPVEDAPSKESGQEKTRGESEQKDEAEVAVAPRWRLKPVVVQVPRAEGQGLLYGKKRGDDSRVIVYAGTPDEAQGWTETARTLPDARELGQWTSVDVGRDKARKISAGKQYHYNKAIRKSKGGAYDIVSGELHHGYIFAFRLKEAGKNTVLSITTTRDSISMPIPSYEVRPTGDLAPIKIERPQWSRAQTTSTIVLETMPAAVLVALQGIDEQKPNDDVVLIVTIEDATATAQPR